MFRANDNQGERQLERTDSSEQVDRANEPDTIKILHYYKDFTCYSTIIKTSPVTVSAEVQYSLFGDSLCDIHLCSDAGYTHVGGIGLYFCATLTA